MRLLFLWTIGLARRRPISLVGTTVGVGLSVALLACLGAFVDSSVKTMTRRGVASLPIDWQILLNSPSNEGADTFTMYCYANIGVDTSGKEIAFDLRKGPLHRAIPAARGPRERAERFGSDASPGDYRDRVERPGRQSPAQFSTGGQSRQFPRNP